MENRIALSSQINDLQPRQIEFLSIGKPIMRLANRPFLRQVQLFCAIEPRSVVVMNLPPAKDRLLNNKLRSMVKNTSIAVVFHSQLLSLHLLQ